MRILHTLWGASIVLSTSVYAQETVQDAARIARDLVDRSLDSVGSMATIFPSEDTRLSAQPFSLPEYYASCHQNGSLTLLFLPISRHSRNILHTPGQATSISITSQRPLASHPRVALIGNVTIFQDIANVPDREFIQQCYLSRHPDAKGWLPDDDEAAHISYWARFDPHTIYFVGGFGDEHYIGYIPFHLYQAAGASKATGVKGETSYGMEQQISMGTRV
ncbi:hypothetical protein P691DRAFT_811793 [Macrolepiota fuliginosa MF-IS2]|uniref:CREG-like beta-barrel domain-containing protein n=1 Tax=Macrolepiota fuliginosa MF-IS2 TaxID=1400762 RepID=A0A9P5XM32_9AGAR|nr:hypothetical protein P691DRAFT_811793 [Macrolepiota fuliginosa MF-IS2]